MYVVTAYVDMPPDTYEVNKHDLIYIYIYI